MSERNGDRARFQKNRQRKLRHRQRIRTLMSERHGKAAQPVATGSEAASRRASADMHSEGSPTRAGE